MVKILELKGCVSDVAIVSRLAKEILTTNDKSRIESLRNGLIRQCGPSINQIFMADNIIYILYRDIVNYELPEPDICQVCEVSPDFSNNEQRRYYFYRDKK